MAKLLLNFAYIITATVILSNAQQQNALSNKSNQSSMVIQKSLQISTIAAAAAANNITNVGMQNLNKIMQLPVEVVTDTTIESITIIPSSSSSSTKLLNENQDAAIDFIKNSKKEMNSSMKQESIESETTEYNTVETTTSNKFEEFTLPQLIPHQEYDDGGTNDDIEPINAFDDTRNIYKIAKHKSGAKLIPPKRHIPETIIIPLKSSNIQLENNLHHRYDGQLNLNIFEIITDLYDQSQWNIDGIANSVSGVCSTDMRIYLKALHNGEPWAIKVSDSSGRYRGQFFFGNDFWIGSKEFCNEINSFNSDLLNAASHVGRKIPMTSFIEQPVMHFYVARTIISMEMPIKQRLPLNVGQCLPKSCSMDDVSAILKLDPYFDALSENTNGTVKLSVLNVRRVPGEYSLWTDYRFYAFAIVCVLLFLICVLATIYESCILINQSSMTKNDSSSMNPNFIKMKHQFELHQISTIDNNNSRTEARLNAENSIHSKLGVLQRLLLSFGLVSNAKAILSTKKLPEESVKCIHGMRMFSMFWTIMVHTYLQMFGIAENRGGRIVAERTFWYQVIGNATYSVDTFFFISGLLVTLLFLRTENKKQEQSTTKLKPTAMHETGKSILLVTYRYLRLTPAYLAVLMFDEISLKYTYNASVFTPGLSDHLTCPHTWWRNILYVQTWFPFGELCMIWSWYLANDMQFYVWAIIILIVSKRYFKTAVTIIFTFLLTSWVTSALISFNLKYVLRISEPLESFGFLYDKAWTRIGPYIMGMVAGYIIYRFKEPPKIRRSINLLLWFISITIMFLLVFGIWNGSLSVEWTAIYVSLGHTAWGMSLIWITLACKWGIGKPIDAILSYRGFLPLSRLTYCTYLIHPVTQILTAFQMEGPMHIKHGMILTIFLGNTIFSYVCAFVISIMFEAPVVRILRILFKK